MGIFNGVKEEVYQQREEETQTREKTRVYDGNLESSDNLDHISMKRKDDTQNSRLSPCHLVLAHSHIWRLHPFDFL